MPQRWTLHYHPSVTSFLYSLRHEVAALTPILRSLQDNPTPENAEPVPGRPGRYEIQLEGYVLQYNVVTEQKIIKVLVVERT
jgi:mRNA-degrading endonuclease RelE of RelBE toxin-antitoxin system